MMKVQNIVSNMDNSIMNKYRNSMLEQNTPNFSRNININRKMTTDMMQNGIANNNIRFSTQRGMGLANIQNQTNTTNNKMPEQNQQNMRKLDYLA